MVTRGARPGGAVEARVALKSPSDTPVDAITLRLTGTERYRYAGNQPAVVVRPIVDLIATLHKGGTLAKGSHTFRARFELPKDATPTYTGTFAFVDYTMTLHVDIPWWPDRRKEYVIEVGPVLHARPARAPIAQTTARGGEEPFLELLLDDAVLAPGDTLSGALALGNLRGRKVKGLAMALVTVERQTGRPAVRGAEFPVHFAPDAVREGKEFPFRFTLDKSIQPTFVSSALSVSYMLEVRADLAWRKPLVHAVHVTIAAMDRPQEGIRSRPRLGTERWRRVWEQAGAALGLSLSDPEDLRLSGSLYRSNASVFMDPDTDEPFFVAQIEWTPWELDLRIKLRTLSILASDPDGDGFGRRYKVNGRDPAQVRALLSGPLRRALLAFDEVYMDDRHARVRSKAPGFEQDHIGAFLARVADLARAIGEASGRIPPPPAMAAMLPAWRAFAEEARGELASGSMCLRRGTVDGARFDIETLFEDGAAPRKTRLTLLPDPPLPDAIDVESPEAWSKALPGSRELAAEVKRGALALRLTPQAMEVDFEGPEVDPGALRPRMELMLALARRLRGEKAAGPYR